MGKPKIRFKGFTEDWEQRKFSDCYKMCSGYAFKMSDYCDEGVGLINGESIQHGIINDDNLNHLPESFIQQYPEFLLKTDDIVVGLNRPITNGNLKIARIPSKYNTSLLYQRAGKIVYRTECDKDFSYFFLSQEILKYALVEAVGSDQPFISTSKLNKWKMAMPSDMKEQMKIGKYFSSLDHIITLHQRKCDETKILKKYMLQKMFPQNGMKVPEIRFEGFAGDWEQRKLGEVVSVCSGKDYKHLDEGDIPVYGTGGYMLSVSDALSNDSDAIGIGRKGTIDKPYILRAPFWTVDTLFYCIPYEKNDLSFVFSTFQNINWKAMDESTGVPSLSKTVINCVDVITPSFEEQEKIGCYFSHLDRLITLHQRKCDELVKIKKYMLQNMFV